MIKTVFLDLDDTIFDFHRAERDALTETFVHFGIEGGEDTLTRYSEINKLHWKKLERGELTREGVLYGRFKMLFEEFKIDCDAVSVQKYYENALGKYHYFMDGAQELLESIRTDYDLYIASNGTASVQDSRIRDAKIAKYFKDIFVSQRIGYEKPREEFFLECFKRIPNFQRESAIIIGDSLSSDIQGGKNAGIKTCLFNPKKINYDSDITADYELHSLKMIPELLKSI